MLNIQKLNMVMVDGLWLQKIVRAQLKCHFRQLKCFALVLVRIM